MSSVSQTIRLMMDVSSVSTSAQQVARQFDGMQKTVGNLSKVLGGAFATNAIIGYANEAVQLGSELTNVSLAFQSLNDPVLLNKLRKATGNTISDLTLMKNAVMAVQLGIDQNQLPKYFEFASQRAKETGQSVDYLVNSIVTGVGRKSTMIIDNLGISSAQLNEEMSKGATFAAAVGNIIDQSMSNAVPLLETAADKQAQLNAQMENQKAIIGQQLQPAYVSIIDTTQRFIAATLQMGEAFAQTEVKWYDFVTGGISYTNRFLKSFDNLTNGSDTPFTGFIDAEVQAFNSMVAKTGDATAVYEMFKARLLKSFREGGDNANDYGMALSRIESEYQRINTVVPKVSTSLGTLKELLSGLQKEQAQATNAQEFQKYQREIDGLNQKILAITTSRRAELHVTELQARSITGLTLATQNYVPALTQLTPAAQIAHDNMVLLNAAIAVQERNMAIATEASYTFGYGLTDSLAGALAGTESFGESFGRFIKQLITRLIAALVVAVALSVVLGGLGFAGAGGTAGKFKELFGAFSGFQIPGLASGGIVTGPTLALVGEGRESEAVIPLSRLDAMMNNSGNSGNFRIDGYDLKLVQDRNQNRINRIR